MAAQGAGRFETRGRSGTWMGQEELKGSADEDVARMIALALRLRLRDVATGFEAQAGGTIAPEVERGGLAGARSARERLVAAALETLDLYARRAQSDMASLVRVLELAAPGDVFWSSYEAALDEAADALFSRLNLPGGNPSVSEKNRLANHAAGLKQRGRDEFEAELTAARRRRERLAGAAGAEPAADQLDDRLPLHRRAVFDRDLHELSVAAGRDGEPLSLVMIDIDHFKQVNDRHGHPVGDEVLLAIAQMAVRRVAHKGKAYRYGGEEFAALLPHYSAEEAAGLAERLRKDVQEEPLGSPGVQVTASFGVACLPDDAANPEALLRKADEALYNAKHGGRNRVCISSEADANREPDRA